MSGRAAPTTPVRKMFGSWGDTRYFADSRDAQTQTEKGGHTMALTGATCPECLDGPVDADGLTTGECAAVGGPISPCAACNACACDGSC